MARALRAGYGRQSGAPEKRARLNRTGHARHSQPLPPAGADYATVKRAIEFISRRYRDQPSVEAIASHVGLSASHFQHVFKRWAGLTPKAFLQAVTIERARELLRDSASVLDAAYDVGLSGPSRLHDLFVAHEALTPGDYRRDDLTLAYGFHPSPFGEAIVVAAPRGMAGLGFVDDGNREAARADMARRWPRARLIEDERSTAPYASRAFDPALWRADAPLRVVLIGTDFELRVWETLLSVPLGRRDHLFRHRVQDRQADGRARRRRRSGQESDLVRRALSSRAGALGRAHRLPLGPRAQAGDHRLGGGADRRAREGRVEAAATSAAPAAARLRLRNRQGTSAGGGAG